MFKIIIITFILIFNLYANEIYILPDDSKKAKENIGSLITNAKSEIFVAMYNFSYNKFAKDLIKASKNGVKITVLFDSKKTKEDDEIYTLLKENGIKTIINQDKNKMHLKIALIDKNIAIIGSTNWTKESFEKNHDLIYISTDKKIVEKLRDYIKIYN